VLQKQKTITATVFCDTVASVLQKLTDMTMKAVATLKRPSISIKLCSATIPEESHLQTCRRQNPKSNSEKN
jgi:hypothetical protein